MRHVKAVLVVCTLLLAMGMTKGALAQAPANVAGTWQMTTQGRRGNMTQTLTFKQDGGKLTGTMTGGMNNATFDLTGTVEGSKISFTVERNTGRGTFTTTYNGTVSGNSIKGTADMGRANMTINWTATRKQ